MVESIGNRIRRLLNSIIYIDSNPEYSASIFLAGTARSGTTWISDIINYRNEYRYIFEPFHPYKVRTCSKYRHRQYLRPDNRSKDFIEPAKAILSGRIRNTWIDRNNKKTFARRRLIKDIRANLLLKWIHVNFPDVPIVLLLRHPCAVANSRLKLNWDARLDDFMTQKELIEDFLNPFKKEIDKVKNIFDKHVLLWCLDYYVPLKQFKRGEIHLAFYENFCEKPRYEIERLLAFLGKPIDERIFIDLKKASPTSRRDSAILTGSRRIDDWRKDISNEKIHRAITILSMFGLDRIYSRDSMPNIANAYDIMGVD